MTSIDIYSILQSKPHNQHYLNRYWKFIQYCQQNPSNDEYLEEHHICPKASDMFPEYACLHDHYWNSVKLSARRHIIAHVMLWKVYKNVQQTSALNYMLNVQNQNTIWFNKRVIPTSIQIRYAAKARQEYYKFRKCTAVYKDTAGNNFLLKTDDPIIKEARLVGVNSGIKFSDESRENLRRSKDANRKITLHFMMFERSVNINSDEMSILIDYGWTPYMQSERYELKKESAKQGVKKAITGKNRFYHKDGTYYGMLINDDPLIEELDLVHIRSDKQKTQAAEQAKKNANNKETQERKGKTMSALKWFHDPVTKENKRLVECPVGWKEGRSESSESNKGRETWNDGIRNYMLKHGEVPDPTWIRGMVPRKKK